MAKPRRSSFVRLLPRDLATYIIGDVPADTPRMVKLLERFFLHRQTADRREIFDHYAPLIFLRAARCVKRWPHFYGSDLDAVISDGAVGLLAAINCYDPRCGVPFIRRAIGRIKSDMRRGADANIWPHAEHHRRALKLTALARADLLHQLGRVPTPEELNAALAGQIHNPAIYVHGEVTQRLDCDLRRDDDDRPLTAVDDAAPDEPMLTREAIAMVMRGLDASDRRILRMSLRGETQTAIAERLGVSRQRIQQRINGICWTARKRADVAAYFGVEQLDPNAPPQTLDGKLPPAQFIDGRRVGDGRNKRRTA